MTRLTEQQGNELKTLAMLLGSINDADKVFIQANGSALASLLLSRDERGWLSWFDIPHLDNAEVLAQAAKNMGAYTILESNATYTTVFINWHTYD